MADGAFALTEAEFQQQAASAWPNDEAGWDYRYSMLWDAYIGAPYGEGLVKMWHLFRAVSDNGEEQDVTMRVHRDFQFIVNAYAAPVAGVSSAGGPVLEVARDQFRPSLPAAEQVWRRSAVAANVERWAKSCAVFGSGGWEIVNTSPSPPYAPQLVWRDARCIRVHYDDTRTRIERVIYEAAVVDPAQLAKVDLRLDQPAITTYRRVLTPTRVEVYRDEKPVPEESYAHGLGRVPFVHVVWEPWTEPEHGLPAGHPLDLAVAMSDSIHCQIRAIGTRMGNPLLVVKGAKLGGQGSSHSLYRLGNTLSNLPADGGVEYAEIQSSINQLLEAVRELRAHVRETEPAYLFADSSAAESGEAKSYRAALFEARVAAIRARFHGGLCAATEIALDVSARRPSAEEGMFTSDLPPALPRNVSAEVATYSLVRDDMKKADRVRYLQRIGMIPADADPDEYALTTEDEGGMGAVDMMRTTAAGVADQSSSLDEAGAEIEEAGAELDDLLGALDPDTADRVRNIREMLADALGKIGARGA